MFNYTYQMYNSQKGKIMNSFNRIMKPLAFIALMAVFAPFAFSAEKKESTGEYFDNTVITTKVKTAILSDPSLKVMQINVDSFKGVVQLSGFVDSRGDSRLAEDIAANIEGVKSVRNDIIVK